MNKPYKACHTSKDEPPYLYGIQGPGQGFGYHSWYLFPEHTFSTLEEAEKVAHLLNLAFNEGMAHRSSQIRELLG